MRTISCLCFTALIVVGLSSSAQTQAPSAQPNISGQVNGVFPEPAPLNFVDHTGFVSLFDGKSLGGWDGRPGVWRIENGVIVGESTPDHKAGNTFLVNRNVTAKDFDLKLEIKVEQGGGSGIQYRSSTGIPPSLRLAEHFAAIGADGAVVLARWRQDLGGELDL